MMWGAITMRLRRWNFGKVIAALGLAGALAGLAGSFAIPEQYVSQAVLRSGQLDRTDPVYRSALWDALQRRSLEAIIERENLYEHELTTEPIFNVMDEMRKNIRVSQPGSAKTTIAFTYGDRYKAQKVTSDIVELIQNNLRAAEILESPSLPLKAAQPNRWMIAAYGFGGGLLTAAILGLFRRPTNRLERSLRTATALGLTGALAGWAVSFAIPPRYVSSGLVVVQKGTDQYFRDLTAEVVDDLWLALLIERTRIYGDGKPTKALISKVRRDIRIEKIPESSREFRISFAYHDPQMAQRVTALLVQSITAENAGKRPNASLEVFEPASFARSAGESESSDGGGNWTGRGGVVERAFFETLMRRVLQFLVRAYPRAWRARYGDEFDALLEDARLC